MHQTGDAFRQKTFRDAVGQRRGKSERVSDIGQRLQFVAHRLFGHVAIQRNERQHHIALSKGLVHLLLGFVHRRTGRVGNRLVAVGKVGHALCHIAGQNQDCHDCQHRLSYPIGTFPQFPALPRDEATVLRAADNTLKAQNERGHEQQHG